jgi:hypothetical protein
MAQCGLGMKTSFVMSNAGSKHSVHQMIWAFFRKVVPVAGKNTGCEKCHLFQAGGVPVRFSTRAGFPTTVTLAGTSRTTTVPAPITANDPI